MLRRPIYRFAEPGLETGMMRTQFSFLRDRIMRWSILILTGGLALPAAAAPVLVGETAEGTQFFLENDSVRRAGAIVRYWEVQNFKTRDEDGVHSMRVRWEMDCRQEKSRILSVSEHAEPMAKGNKLETDNRAGEWSDLPAGTAGRKYFELLCQPVKSGS